MLKIKEEYLDIYIFDPLTRKEIYVRFIPKELYGYYNNNGYKILFEEEILESLDKDVNNVEISDIDWTETKNNNEL